MIKFLIQDINNPSVRTICQLSTSQNKNMSKNNIMKHFFHFHMPLLNSNITVVEIIMSPDPWECMSRRGRLKTIGQIHFGCLRGFFLKLIFICWNLRERPTCFQSYKCTLFMSVWVEKAGCTISDLAPYYYTACFHFMPVLLFFRAYDFQNRPYIFCENV